MIKYISKIKNSLSFKNRLLLVMIVTIFIPSLLITTIVYSVISKSINKIASENSLNTSRILEGYFNGKKEELVNLALNYSTSQNIIGVLDVGNRIFLNSVLMPIFDTLKKEKNIMYMEIFDGKGESYLTLPKEHKKISISKNLIKEAQEEKTVVEYGFFENSLILKVLVPLKSNTSNQNSVMFIVSKIDETSLVDLTKVFKEKVTIFDQGSPIITLNSENAVNTNIEESIFKEILKGEALKINNGSNYIYYIPFKNYSDSVVGVFKVDNDLSTMYNLKNFLLMVSIIISVITLITGIILSIRISKNLTKPLQELVHVTEVISSGKLKTRVSIARRDEFGILGEKFNKMTDTLENNIVELEKMNQLKDNFLANTSHELRTPLNGIIGIVDSLIEGVSGALPEVVIKNLNLILSSGKRLSNLVNDLLDFSKITSDDIVLRKTKIDMLSLVDSVISVLEKTKSNNLEIINNISENDAIVYADTNRMEQILFNLLGNALKFTHEGTIKIYSKKRNDFIQITVEDTGIGIAQENFERIFNSFEQADGSTSRDYGGTGLGLSITKKLVKAHGGEIWVESEINKGSKFNFTVQRSEKEDEEEIKVENFRTQESVDSEKIKEHVVSYILDTKGSRENTGDKFEEFKTNVNKVRVEKNIDVNTTSDILKDKVIKVLVVDDDRINIQVLLNYLEFKNYQSDFALNGVEALAKLESNQYDIVLLDIMMPKMSGYEVLAEIRKEYSIIELPVVLLTAKNRPEDMVTGFNMGANDYLTKPFEKLELFARIKTLVSLRYAVIEAVKNAEMANTDSLTGMKNRRYLYEFLAYQYNLAKRNNQTISMFMIDIDKFKGINDTYGHDIGDEILKIVANILINSIRNVDIVARIGGEEFGVVMLNTKEEQVIEIAERIRENVEKGKLVHKEYGEICCTISIGIAFKTSDAIEELFKKADKMLYKAKLNGRNRIEIFEEESLMRRDS